MLTDWLRDVYVNFSHTWLVIREKTVTEFNAAVYAVDPLLSVGLVRCPAMTIFVS